MLAAAAAIALLLGVIGVYGVIAYTVGMRTREIGLRLALGARPGLVRMMIVNQGVRLVAAGIVAGLALTFMLTRSLQALLYGVSHNDPATLLLVTVAVAEASGVGLRLPEPAWLLLFGVALLAVGRVARQIVSRRHERRSSAE